jgi:DNA-directed RNA polymerase III subunit RPC8
MKLDGELIFIFVHKKFHSLSPMFVLSEIKDSIRVKPINFSRPKNEAILDEINKKYSYKIVQELGFCLFVYDIIGISEAVVHACQDGSYQCQGIM